RTDHLQHRCRPGNRRRLLSSSGGEGRAGLDHGHESGRGPRLWRRRIRRSRRQPSGRRLAGRRRSDLSTVVLERRGLMRAPGGPRAITTAAVLAVLLSACAGTPAALRPDAARAPVVAGYLDETVVAALADAVPPPPAPGSAEDLDDKARSARFIALEDTDRWLLATAHAELRPPLALQHFDCALDARLDPAAIPQLTRLMQRLFHDADSAAERVKARAHRPRPVGDD